jgi:hypothetical protein
MHPLALAHRFETMRAKLQTLLLDSDDACTSEFCMFFSVAATFGQFVEEIFIFSSQVLCLQCIFKGLFFVFRLFEHGDFPV